MPTYQSRVSYDEFYDNHLLKDEDDGDEIAFEKAPLQLKKESDQINAYLKGMLGEDVPAWNFTYPYMVEDITDYQNRTWRALIAIDVTNGDLPITGIAPDDATPHPSNGLTLGETYWEDYRISTVGGSGDVSGEMVEYQTLLNTSGYKECYYDTFVTDEVTTPVNTLTNTTWNAEFGWYEGDVGTIIETPNLIETPNSGIYFRFVSSDESQFEVSISVDGGTVYEVIDRSMWSLKNQAEIQFSTSETDVRLKFTWLGAGNLESFGILYDFETPVSFQKDNKMYGALTLTESKAVNDIIYLPFGRSYTLDQGKSLSVFLDGVRLTDGIDYNEHTSKSIESLININIGSTLVFEEVYGYTDFSTENKTRMDLEHLNTGEHAFTDTITGVVYTFQVTNGAIELIEVI